MRLTTFIPALLLAFGQQTIPPPPRPPASAPTQPARDTGRRLAAEPTGTASIRGRVVTSDTGTAVRHAAVNLSIAPQASVQPGQAAAGPVPLQVLRPRSTTTDASGAFEFKDLPAGEYRLSASPGQFSAQYLGISYGAKRPNGPGSNDPGQSIHLSDGQAFTGSLALPKGTVITGRVADENGEPLARVMVYALFFPPGSLRGQRYGQTVQTDDLGSFRLYGLAPGEYAVAAEARSNTYVPPNAPPETEEERVGWLTTYYPNTPDEASAQHVRTRSSAETPGIEIRLTSGRMVHISGMVVDSQGKQDTRFFGQLIPRSSFGAGMSNLGLSIDQTGRFQMRNIPPGDYRLVVRQNVVRPPNADSRTPTDPGEFAIVPLALSNDVDDMLITTSPGVTITGQIVYDGDPPAAVDGQSPSTRVYAQFPESQNPGPIPMPQSVLVSADLTFTMKGFMGEYLLRAGGGASQYANQYLKAVQLGGEDITDTPREFRQGDRVTIVMTTRASTIEGTVTDDQGQPVNAASLLLFSDDKTYWRVNSVRTRRGGVDSMGHFKLPGLLAGRYYLIALPSERVSLLNGGSVDPAVFEQFAKEATPVTVGEDDQRQVDLRVSIGSGG